MSEGDLISRFKKDARLLHPLEFKRLTEFYEQIVPYLRASSFYRVKYAGLAGSGQMNDFLQSEIGIVLTKIFLNGHFDRNKGSPDDFRLKFEYAASGARLKIIDAIRYSRRKKRSNGLPTWSFDGGFDKPGFERPQVLPLGKGSGFEQIVSRLPLPKLRWAL